MPTTATHPDIGTALRYYRECAGMTREQAAVHVGRTTQTIRDWETGNRTPRLVFVGKLAGLYGVRTGELLDSVAPSTEGGDR